MNPDPGTNAARRMAASLCRVFAAATWAALAASSGPVAAQAPPSPTSAEREACAKGRSPQDATQCLQPRVWFEYGLATVATGLNDRGQHVGRRLTLVVVGPGEEAMSDRAEQAIRAEHRKRIEEVEKTLRHGLDFSILAGDDQLAAALKAPNVNPKAEHTRITSEIGRDVQRRLLEAALAYQRLMAPTWRAQGVDGSRFQLAVIDLPCDPAAGCRIPQYAYRPDNLSFDRYAKYRDWARGANTLALSTPHVLQLGSTPAGAMQLTIRADKAVRPPPGRRPVEPSLEENTRRFERLVAEARKTRFDVSTTVPELVGLSQRNALAVADVIKSPLFSISQLPVDGKAVLTQVSDEIARSRLMECVRLRGTLTPEQAGECAGYKVSAQELAVCLNTGRCWPASGTKMTVDLLLIADPKALPQLAKANALARLRLGSVDEFEKAVKKCGGDKPMASHEVTAQCVMKQRLSERDRGTLECIEKLRKPPYSPGGAGFESCLSAARVSEVTATQARCVRNHANDAKALAMCTTLASLPPATKLVVECVNRPGGKPASPQAVSECLLTQQSPQAAAALRCYREKPDWKEAALCAAGPSLPDDAKKALMCAQKNPDSAAKLGVCMVGDQLPGDGAKVALCMAQSGGDPFGTAVCAAGDGLSPEQRIALQCAASTGGEPTSFAICAGGQLAIKELMNCQGKKFGQHPCFGENNEFRKLAKTLGLEIGPKSVVADVINVHLQVLDAQVHFATEAIKEAQKIAKAIESVAQQVGKVAENVVREGGKAACKFFTVGMGKC